ncbi:hypothetical protein HAX54_040198, partial [Datura stramonium]|nr:hypothetical protein [Datura stramonium]
WHDSGSVTGVRDWQWLRSGLRGKDGCLAPRRGTTRHMGVRRQLTRRTCRARATVFFLSGQISADFRRHSASALPLTDLRVTRKELLAGCMTVNGLLPSRCGSVLDFQDDELIGWESLLDLQFGGNGKAHGTKGACVQASEMTRLDNIKG